MSEYENCCSLTVKLARRSSQIVFSGDILGLDFLSKSLGDLDQSLGDLRSSGLYCCERARSWGDQVNKLLWTSLCKIFTSVGHFG